MGKRKIFLSVILVTILAISSIPVNTSANQSAINGFAGGYSITGNGGDDMVSIAIAQTGRTRSQFGYTEDWCADFVVDCAEIAGQGTAIPRTGAYANVSGLKKVIIDAGGVYVNQSQALPGDICIYGNDMHVEIVASGTGSNIQTIGGNNGDGEGLVRGVRLASIVAPYFGGSITLLRPNYKEKQQFSLPIISDPSVYLKQAYGSNTCTLVSLLNLFRRGTLLFEHNSASTGYWYDFTEANYKSSWWNDSAGVTWNQTAHWLSSVFRTRSKGSGNKQFFADYLMHEPQGVVIYYSDSSSGRSHAVLLTKYIAATDTFYCVDPAPGVGSGEIPLTESLLGSKDYVGYNTGRSNNTQEDILYNIERYCTLQIDTGTETNTGFNRDDFLLKVYPNGNPKPSKPGVPVNLKASKVDDTTVATSWNAADNATGYEVQYRQNGSDWLNAGGYSSGTSFNSTSLSSTIYEYRVRAKNTGGVSEWSAILTYDNRKTPGKPVAKADKLKYESGDTASFSWNSTAYTSDYEIVLEKKSNNNWIIEKRWVNIKTTSITNTMGESGDWRIKVVAHGDDSTFATESDYAYFSAGIKQTQTPTPTPTVTSVPTPTDIVAPTPTDQIQPVPTDTVTTTPIPTPPEPTLTQTPTPPAIPFEIDDSISVSVGKTKTLDPDIYREDLMSDDLVWTSSDNSVATVTNDGVIRGISAGTATITAYLNDYSYSDSCMVTVSQAAVPGAKIKKLKAGKSYIKVTWKKVSGIDGYQIAISTSQDMSKPKYYSVKAKSTSKKIKKLIKGTTYYVQIRTYKTVDGKKVYSKWSGKKKIKYSGK
ncbi:MAG: fibronectin type III domain-containing protein [Lachnospiraceae bacterium]|nr:fibronectin type III domain-containing protein [Lachnospiraceae bacterium]